MAPIRLLKGRKRQLLPKKPRIEGVVETSRKLWGPRPKERRGVLSEASMALVGPVNKRLQRKSNERRKRRLRASEQSLSVAKRTRGVERQ
jgi:hypothetical protein